MDALVPRPLLQLRVARAQFLEEARTEYRAAVKKATVDYVLLDDGEQERLGVPMPKKVRNFKH